MTMTMARGAIVSLFIWLGACALAVPPVILGQEASPVAIPATPPAVSGGPGWHVAAESAVEVDGEPVALSPDGQWIAGLGLDGDFCIWQVENLEPACDGEELRIRPETIAWAPDSSAVAFALNTIQFGIDSDLYVFAVEDNELRNLTDDGYEGDVFQPETDERILMDDVPAWSPDGQELAFARAVWAPEGERATTLMRIARDGGEPEAVVQIRPKAPFGIYTPMDWLENDRLLFSIIDQELKADQNGVWIVGLDGSGLRQVLPGDATAEAPAPWIVDISPDGRTASIFSQAKLAQFAEEGAVFYLLDLETGELAPITPGGEQEERIVTPPRFSPDGTALLYAVSSDGGDTPLVVRDATTGDQAILAEGVELGGAVSNVPALFRGFDWAENDTVLLPGTLLTLEQTTGSD